MPWNVIRFTPADLISLPNSFSPMLFIWIGLPRQCDAFVMSPHSTRASPGAKRWSASGEWLGDLDPA
jgi:hypothetical protein